MAYLGIDTSNYTTSVALYYPEENRIVHRKKFLPVKEGEKGLRQSDAVFHHTVQLHEITEELFSEVSPSIDGVCASAFPRMAEGSYMPCFLVGLNTAKILATVLKKDVKITSHQNGHIVAALYSADRLDLLKERFIAFHVSGGTTEALLVEPDEAEVIKCTLVASSLDLKAGQAIDRAGVMMGLRFPSGAEMDLLSQKSERSFGKIKVFSKGADVSLSGLENKCRKMLSDGESKEDISRFCFQYICSALETMTDRIIEEYGNLPLLYSGGVMSNSIIRERLTKKYNGIFASPEFSADNAAGVAILACFKENKK
ncbi:MAG: peptidase M22 [Clostridia bacterium]|nr:peptidase M22 [Clostridia bacterium]